MCQVEYYSYNIVSKFKQGQTISLKIDSYSFVIKYLNADNRQTWSKKWIWQLFPRNFFTDVNCCNMLLNEAFYFFDHCICIVMNIPLICRAYTSTVPNALCNKDKTGSWPQQENFLLEGKQWGQLWVMSQHKDDWNSPCGYWFFYLQHNI